MLFYPSVPSLDEQTYLFGIATTTNYLDTLPLAMHFLDDAHRSAARFIQFLLDRHATKVAFFFRSLLSKRYYW